MRTVKIIDGRVEVNQKVDGNRVRCSNSRCFVIFMLAALLLSIYAHDTYALGMSPSFRQSFFSAGETAYGSINIVNNEAKDMQVRITVSGKLADTIVLDRDIVRLSAADSGLRIGYEIRYPERLDPGNHEIIFSIEEVLSDEELLDMISRGLAIGKISVESRLNIISLHDGKRAVSEMIVYDAEYGDDINIIINSDNMGNEDIAEIFADIMIYENFQGNLNDNMLNDNMQVREGLNSEGLAARSNRESVDYEGVLPIVKFRTSAAPLPMRGKTQLGHDAYSAQDIGRGIFGVVAEINYDGMTDILEDTIIIGSPLFNITEVRIRRLGQSYEEGGSFSNGGANGGGVNADGVNRGGAESGIYRIDISFVADWNRDIDNIGIDVQVINSDGNAAWQTRYQDASYYVGNKTEVSVIVESDAVLFNPSGYADLNYSLRIAFEHGGKIQEVMISGVEYEFVSETKTDAIRKIIDLLKWLIFAVVILISGIHLHKLYKSQTHGKGKIR